MVEVTCEKTVNLVFWNRTNMRHLYSFWVLFFCYSVDSSIHPLNNWDLMVINISQSCTWSYISNTRKSVSSDIQTLKRGLKKRGAAECFKPTSKCLDIWWNTLPHVWYSFSKLILFSSRMIKNNSWRNSNSKPPFLFSWVINEFENMYMNMIYA